MDPPYCRPDRSCLTIAERLIAIGRTGFTFLNVALADADARRRFAAEVTPLVRYELARQQ